LFWLEATDLDARTPPGSGERPDPGDEVPRISDHFRLLSMPVVGSADSFAQAFDRAVSKGPNRSAKGLSVARGRHVGCGFAEGTVARRLQYLPGGMPEKRHTQRLEDGWDMRGYPLGICVMTIVPLLYIATEYLGTGDHGRTVSKIAASIIGLPILIWASSAGLRWAAVKRFRPLWLLVGGMLSAGMLYAMLLYGMHVASFFIAILQPATGAWGPFAALRVGFAMGVTNFGLWALAFVFPFAIEDARFRALEAQQLRTAAELARLSSHLEPHFLLNTLNAIAGLTTENPRAARRLLASLGDLLRDSLRDEGEMQPLGEQIDWLRNYAQILEERHAGQLAFAWKVAAETRAALLPRLLLQPLVENAVKHGALRRKDGGRIEVRAEVVDAKKLVCTIEDNGLGMPAGKTRPGAFGLLSVRRRLALQYAERASFRLESSASGTRSIVEIPIEETRS
jgi:signal transduction histidine kinase